MSADVATMDPTSDGGDEENLKALEDLVYVATEALRRFRR